MALGRALATTVASTAEGIVVFIPYVSKIIPLRDC